METVALQPSKQSQESTPTSNPSEQLAECEACQGTRWAVKNGKASRCPCTLERRIQAALPERYWRSRLSNFTGTAFATVADWISNPSDGLFVTGPCGTGKTHLAAGIVRHFVESKTSAAFRRCAEFYSAVREMYRLEESEALLLSPLLNPRLLVLDDLGAGSLSDSERRFTLEVLDRRANRLKATVVTSNWSLQEIAEKLDDRIASRLSGFTRLELSGEDRRMRR